MLKASSMYTSLSENPEWCTAILQNISHAIALTMGETLKDYGPLRIQILKKNIRACKEPHQFPPKITGVPPPTVLLTKRNQSTETLDIK